MLAQLRVEAKGELRICPNRTSLDTFRPNVHHLRGGVKTGKMNNSHLSLSQLNKLIALDIALGLLNLHKYPSTCKYTTLSALWIPKFGTLQGRTDCTTQHWCISSCELKAIEKSRLNTVHRD